MTSNKTSQGMQNTKIQWDKSISWNWHGTATEVRISRQVHLAIIIIIIIFYMLINYVEASKDTNQTYKDKNYNAWDENWIG